MRHKVVRSKLGRSTAHRNAMLANLVCNLIREKQIKTTLSKAKMTRRIAEKMVTLAKRGLLADRRKAMAILRQKPCVKTLFEEIAPQCKDRSGGYVRILKLGQRISDSSEMALMQWVTIQAVDKKKKTVPEGGKQEPAS